MLFGDYDFDRQRWLQHIIVHQAGLRAFWQRDSAGQTGVSVCFALLKPSLKFYFEWTGICGSTLSHPKFTDCAARPKSTSPPFPLPGPGLSSPDS